MKFLAFEKGIAIQPFIMKDGTLRPRPVAICVLAASCLGVAAVVSAYLAWRSLGDRVIPGCGPESACAMLIHSRWGKVAEIPVGAPAAAIYLLLAVSSLRRHPLPIRQRLLQTSAFVLVLGAAVWFATVQVFIVKAFCPWCSFVHLVASLAVLMLWAIRAPAPTDKTARGWLFPGFVIPIGALAIMAWLQFNGSEPERYKDEPFVSGGVRQSAGMLRLYDGLIEFDPTGLPSIGDPAAEITAVALTDFSCPHCRALHRTLQTASAQRPGRFNVVLLPGYHDEAAEKLHRIMFSLWRIDPALFQEISESIVNGTVEPNADAAVAAAQSTLGGKFFELAFRETRWVDETLALGKRLLAANKLETGTVTLPQLIIANHFLAGNPSMETILAVADGAPAPALNGFPQEESPTSAAVPLTSPPPASSSPIPALGARISFTETTLDLGTVIKGKTASGTFRFGNPGTQPLEIIDLRASCGCTTVEGYKQTVPPGGEGSFQVILDTKDLAGVVNKAILLSTNTGPMPVRLGIKADVWTPVRLSASGISFGSILKGGNAPEREIEFTVIEGEEVRIEEHQCTNPYFKTELIPLEEGRLYQLKVSIPQLGDRVQQGKVIIPLNHHLVPQLEIPLYVNPVDPMTIYPPVVFLSARILDTPSKSMVSVQCHDDKLAQLEVANIRVSGSQKAAVDLRTLPEIKRAMIEVTFPAGFDAALAVREHAALQFETNHADYRETRIPIILPGGPPAVPSH